MGSPFLGILTTQAISDVLSQPTLIQVTSFSVSETSGALDPNRTSANPTWYSGIFSSPGIVEDGMITTSVTIPPSTISVPLTDGSLISELYLFASTDGGPEYLFAIIQPPDNTPIVYSDIVKYDIDIQIQFSSGSITNVFEFIYNANEVEDHNLDPDAHQRRWVLKAGDTMLGAFKTAIPVTLSSASGILTLPSTSNNFIVNGTEAITSVIGWTSGQVTIRWNTVRTITYNATSLITIIDTNRTTQIGDVGIYEFTTAGIREISYAPVGDYARRLGSSTTNFSVADATTQYHAVNLGQVNALRPDTTVTYSVNNGNTDVNGYGDIITKINNTEINFKVGGPYSNMGVTFPNGRYYEISSIPNVTGINADGSYTVVLKESTLVKQLDGTYSATAVITTSTITEEITYPTSPVDGGRHLLINQKPYKPYIRQSSTWVEEQYIKIGEFLRQSSVIGTPITYAFNGRYESGRFAISGSSKYIKNHYIGTNKIKTKTYAAIVAGGELYENFSYQASSSGGAGTVGNINKNTMSYIVLAFPWVWSDVNVLTSAVEGLVYAERSF